MKTIKNITFGEEFVHTLASGVTHKEFAKDFKGLDKDIFFHASGLAHETKRRSNLIYHAKNKGQGTDMRIRYVYCGLEDAFYDIIEYYKMLNSIYYGRKSQAKELSLDKIQ